MIRRCRALLPVLLAMAGVIPVQRRIDASLGGFRAQEEVLYVWSGEHIRRVSPGIENLMADVYWLRTVQYFGGVRAFSREKRFELLDPLMNITITFDPRFEIAYRYGAVFLCEPWPVGKGNPRAGVALLERGVRTLPASWRLRQDLGYFRFIFLNDADRPPVSFSLPRSSRGHLTCWRRWPRTSWGGAVSGTLRARSGRTYTRSGKRVPSRETPGFSCATSTRWTPSTW